MAKLDPKKNEILRSSLISLDIPEDLIEDLEK